MDMDRAQPVAAVAIPGGTTLPDAEIIERILAGERALFEILMRRHNQQLYRAARAVVNDETEVEDILQQAYFNAFTHLRQFEDRARFSTWMTRIVLNEAFARRRKRQQLDGFSDRLGDHDGETMEATTSQPESRATGVLAGAAASARRCRGRTSGDLSHGVHAARYRGAEHQ